MTATDPSETLSFHNYELSGEPVGVGARIEK